ncbi:MAG TPA: hypothetical protein VHO69_00785 [Phototrophicaceae bacterium]|nr:hypothetical protein [Phototrophicaceae bacterium]
MTQTRSTRRVIGSIIFIIIVVISGVALAANGNLSNPFTVIPEISALVSGTVGFPGAGGERPEGGGEGRPAMGPSGGERTRPEGRPEGFGERDGGNDTTIQWSAFGGVLFNVWFIAAVTAVIMIVSYPLGFVVKRLRRPRPALTTS